MPIAFVVVTAAIVVIAVALLALASDRRRRALATRRSAFPRLPPDPKHGLVHQCKAWLLYPFIALRLKNRQQASAAAACRLRLDSPADLSSASDRHGRYAIDSAYINGFSADGVCAVFLRVCRRPAGKAELWLAVQHDDLGLLRFPAHPKCHVDGGVDGFSAQGLRLECVEPGRIWKATYSGLLSLERANSAGGKRKAFVRLRLRWSAFTGMFDFESQMHPWAIADALAQQTAAPEAPKKLEKEEDRQLHWEQWGQMTGKLTVDGGEGEFDLNLRGMRDRSIGRRKWADLRAYCLHFGHLKNGSVFHVAVISTKNTFARIASGYVIKPNGVSDPVTSCTFDLAAFSESKSLPTNYSFVFQTANDTYEVQCQVEGDLLFLCGLPDDEAEIHERKTQFIVNGSSGIGVNEVKVPNVASLPTSDDTSEARSRRDTGNSPPRRIPAPTDGDGMTTRLGDPDCRLTELTGGKGSQLAKLAAMKSSKVLVPGAFCVTSAALDKHLEANPDLKRALKDLRSRFQSDLHSGIQQCFERIQSAFSTSVLPGEVRESVHNQYDALCNGNSHRLVAVRSSAVGEDDRASSAAGQMDTYLNLQGIGNVLNHIVKCWASLYTHQAVQYRRQHGWPVITPMAVVVQRMIPARTAGVLFTSDPITGNPKSILINAACGLGETVVSGQTDPDEIRLERDDGSLRVTSVNGSSNDAVDCCLSSEQIIRLAHLGVEIEDDFGFAVDIEWAEYNGKFFVLQTRPITTLQTETDDELMHELDTALASDSEQLTTYNIGEVSPGASTPLSQSVFLNTIEMVMQDLQVQWGVMSSHVTPAYKCLASYSGHGFINLHTLGNTYENNSLLGDKRACELSLCGRSLPDLTMDMIVSHNGKSSFLRRLKNGCASLRYIINGSGKLPELQLLLDNQYIQKKSLANDMYEEIGSLLPVLFKTWSIHLQLSAKSGALSGTLVRIINSCCKELTTEVLSDVALLLSTCKDVVSADVPTALEKLAKGIIRLVGRQMALKFTTLEVEDALNWLKSSGNESVSSSFQSFLDKHGHRCLRENELREQPWGANPSSLIPILQALIRSFLGKVSQSCNADTNTDKVDMTKNAEGMDSANRAEQGLADQFTPAIADDAVINSMKTKLPWITKKLVRLILPRARSAVRQREMGKSLAVRMSDRFRDAYRHLGRLLVAEEYLPETDLMFFLTHYEIGQLLGGQRCLVAKALRRRKLHRKQMDLTFPPLNVGQPRPIRKVDGDLVRSNNVVKLSGLPVSQGVVKGKARVVLDVQSAAQIQPGEILITRCTDVGWTPYFPLIAGLVTELGGLLSHGAVVAREYGLPCVAGVPAATLHIQTGDRVLLNATGGTITKLNIS